MAKAITYGVCAVKIEKGQARKINRCYEAYFQKIGGKSFLPMTQFV